MMIEILQIYLYIAFILGGLYGMGQAIIGITKSPTILAFNNDTIPAFIFLGLVCLTIIILAIALSIFMFPVLIIDFILSLIFKKRGVKL